MMNLRYRPNLLGVARISLGAVLVVRTTALSNLLPTPLAHVRGLLYGWPDPSWPVAWGDLRLPPGVREVAAIVRTVVAGCFLLGLRARVAGTIAGGLGLLAMSQDPFGFIFTLYTLFVGTIVLANTDATSRLALRPDPPLDPRSSIALVRVFVASIYVWSAVAKMHADWLGGQNLLFLAEGHLLLPGPASLLVARPLVRIAAAWGVMSTELAVGLGVLSARTNLFAVVAALAMHGVFELAARPDVMGWVMASLLVACAATVRVAR